MIVPVRMIVALALTFAGAAAASFIGFRQPPPPPKSVPARPVGARLYYPAGRYPFLTMPDGRRQPVKSLLRHRRALKFGEYLWNDAAVPDGAVWVRVDLSHQTLSVFRDDQEIGSTVILFGANSKPTPVGVYPVLARAVHHRSTLYDAEMPYMLRLTGDGVAIHASSVRARSATHGCIGVPLAFARLLFAEVRKGDLVAIVASAEDPKR